MGRRSHPAAGKAARFEQIVECRAYIAWRAMERGARLRFRTQDFDRKCLALVEPTGRKVPAPDDENSCQIVFTLNVGKMQAAGWTRARYYTPVAPQEATREP